MAKISTVTDTTMFQIKSWLGINENEDGETRLKLGEAAEMRNWRITASGSLQIRPGTVKKRKFGSFSDGEWVGTKIQGMWYGMLYDGFHFVVASGCKVYDVDMDTIVSSGDHKGEYDVTELTGSVSTGHVEFFPYQDKLYIMDGVSYQCWDGHSAGISAVDPYIPTILIGCSLSNGSGTTLEQINLLGKSRKVKYSVPSGTPAGEKIYFVEIPGSIVKITNEVTGTDYATADIQIHYIDNDSTKGIEYVSVSGASYPVGSNTLSIIYNVRDVDDESDTVKKMKFWEFFNGANDNRVFLYGDGTNKCIYSGLTEDGEPTAEYFPAMNEISFGEENTPITAMCRHFSRLIVFKSNATYSVQYSAMTLEDGTVTAGFYLNQVNRSIGNQAPGQVRLVFNNPLSLYNGTVYQWRSNSSKNANITFDERQAINISDRVEETLKSFDFPSCYCFDHDFEREYYICCDGKVLVYNYGVDAWYIYENLNVNSIVEINKELYFGMEDGTIRLFTRDARADFREEPTYDDGVMTDDGLDAIDAYWRSGSLAFDRDWKRKYSTMLWVGFLPENDSKFTITAESDRRFNYPEKVVAFGTVGFDNINFADFTFGALKISQMKRVKLKIKKYVFYRLIFESNSKINTATIVSTDILVRYAGNTK